MPDKIQNDIDLILYAYTAAYSSRLLDKPPIRIYLNKLNTHKVSSSNSRVGYSSHMTWTRVGLESSIWWLETYLTKCKKTCDSTWTLTSVTRDLDLTWASWLEKTCYFPQTQRLKSMLTRTAPSLSLLFTSSSVCVSGRDSCGLSARHPIRLDPRCFDLTAFNQSN